MTISSKPPKIHLNQQIIVHLLHNQEILQAVNEQAYWHWDKLKHITPPHHLSPKQWWSLVKIARTTLSYKLQFNDQIGKPFVLHMPNLVLRKLHEIERNHTINLNSDMQEYYSVHAFMREAIYSSQLAGATITQQAAKDLLMTKRNPANQNEKMIWNNYRALQFVYEIRNQPLSVEAILKLNHLITDDDIDADKNMELTQYLTDICKFINAKSNSDEFFIHPIIKAILLHFMLMESNPFFDGNAQTARALFYWAMLHQGYWLTNFISLAQIIKQSPHDYERALLYTKTDDNDVTYFVIHQLDCILQAINLFFEKLNAHKQEFAEIEMQLNANPYLQNKLNYRQIALINHAWKHPATNYLIETHKQLHNITYDTARTDLLNLAKINLFIKKKKGKAFSFAAIENLKERITNFSNYLVTS